MDEQDCALQDFEFCLPDISKSMQKDYQHVFAEYGCSEAINMEYDEMEQKFVFMSKKQRPLMVDQTTANSKSNWIFMPKHPVLPIGKPHVVSKLLKLPSMNDLWSQRVLLESKDRKYSANVEFQIQNLLIDHPDIACGTFLEMFGHYFPYKSAKGECGIWPKKKFVRDLKQLPEKFLPKFHSIGVNSFPKEFDPSMFDIPHDLLNELLLEEMTSETKKLIYDASYCGGCLSYKHVDSRNDFDYGILVKPGGQAMDQLSIQLLCTDTCKEYEDLEQDAFFPQLHTGSDLRFQLNGRVLQTDIQQSSERKLEFVVGTRSLNDILLSSFLGTKVDLCLDVEGNYQRLSYSSDNPVQNLGVLHSPSVITSMSVNPYITEECVIATEEQKMYLWRASHDNKAVISQVGTCGIDMINTERLSRCEDNWRQVEFASHPRQVYVANRKEVDVVDIRGKNASTRILCESKEPSESDELIMSILSGSKFTQPNEFQCIVATPCELLLMDMRHCRMPLLKWALTMRTPCQHLASVGFSVDRSNRACDMRSMILCANQRPQEVHMYQYSTCSKPINQIFQSANHQETLSPPVSLAPPYQVGSFKDVRRSVMGQAHRCLGHLKDRLSYPIVGLCGFSYKTPHGGQGAVALQLSGCGDLLYQSFDLRNPKETWNLEGVISGSTFQCRSGTRKKQNVILAEKKHAAWAETVTSDFLKATKNENPINLRCTQTTLNAFKLSTQKLLPNVMSHFTTKTPTKCVMCKNLCYIPNKPETTDSTFCIDEGMESGSTFENAQRFSECNEDKRAENDDVCQSCKTDIGFGFATVANHRNRTFHPINVQWSTDIELLHTENMNQRYKRPNVRTLKLVKPKTTRRSLGRILVSTWDGSYEELWKSMKQDSFKDFEDERIKEQRKKFDLVERDSDNFSPISRRGLNESAKQGMSGSTSQEFQLFDCEQTPSKDMFFVQSRDSSNSTERQNSYNQVEKTKPNICKNKQICADKILTKSSKTSARSEKLSNKRSYFHKDMETGEPSLKRRKLKIKKPKLKGMPRNSKSGAPCDISTNSRVVDNFTESPTSVLHKSKSILKVRDVTSVSAQRVDNAKTNVDKSNVSNSFNFFNLSASSILSPLHTNNLSLKRSPKKPLRRNITGFL